MYKDVNISDTSSQAFTLQTFITTTQGCASSEFALQALLQPDQTPASTQQRYTRERIETPEKYLPPDLAERLSSLPFRMAQPLGRPASPADFLTTASSLTPLIQCFALSYSSDDAQVTWKAMMQWFQMIPGRFVQILQREALDAAALIILGHWAVLVQRAERYHWFLRGSAARLMREITEKLPQDAAIQELVLGLL